MSVTQNRFKQANAPLGLRAAAPGMPAQARTARRDYGSAVGASGEDTKCRAWGQS